MVAALHLRRLPPALLGATLRQPACEWAGRVERRLRGGAGAQRLEPPLVLGREADADREVAATMRYNSPLDTPSSDAGPQIRGGSAPAASMGAGRASDDSLSLPFSTGLGPDGPLVSSSTVRERTSSLHFRVAQTN